MLREFLHSVTPVLFHIRCVAASRLLDMEEMMEVEDTGEREGLTGAAGVWSVHAMTLFAVFVVVGCRAEGEVL
jgi:hypothetical protein